MPRYWLLKSEPDVFSFDDLMKAPKKTTGWDGVRNYQARNLLRDEIKPGDQVLVYHSNEGLCVVGIAEVVKAGYPDPTQFEKGHDHHDPDSTPDDPRWYQVDLKAVRKLPRPVTLEQMKKDKLLQGMPLLQRGQRLSVQPVAPHHFARVLAMAGAPQE